MVKIDRYRYTRKSSCCKNGLLMGLIITSVYNTFILDTLIQLLKLDKKVMVIDLIEKDVTVETLVETRINCMAKEKV